MFCKAQIQKMRKDRGLHYKSHFPMKISKKGLKLKMLIAQ